MPETGEEANFPIERAGNEGAPESDSTMKRRIASGAVVGSALVALAFQQSPGNEALRTMVALNVLDTTQNALASGAAVGAVTMAIEGGTSTLIALGLHQEKSAVRRIVNKFKKRDEVEPSTDELNAKPSIGSRAADIGIALGVGPGIVMTKHHLKEKEPKLRTDVARGLGFSALGATVSAGLGYLIAGGVQHADKVGLGKPAELLVEYGTDWKVWAGALVGGFVVSKAYSKSKQFFNRNQTPSGSSE